MNLLRIIPSLDPRGGGPMESARHIDAQLIRNNHSVEVVCLDTPSQPFWANYPATVHALGPTKLSYRYSPKLVPWLRDNHMRFDAVIVDGLWQYHSFATWRVLSSTDTPYFVFTHGMLDPWFKHTYPLKHLKKWLYWPWAEYRVLRDARAVIFTCEEERLLARQSFWLYRAKEAVTSFGTSSPPGNGDELSKRFLEKQPQLQDKRIVLFLGRIHEKKGCDLLLDAFARIASNNPRLHLLMAGPDQADWVAKLRAQANKIGIVDQVSWPGMLQGDDKWGAFYAAEVFCLPSHQENFGIVVAEALGCGKPVLISNKVNIWQEIEADGAGIVREDTVTGTLDGLMTWLTLSPEQISSMSNAARKCFENRFQIQHVASSLLNIIKNSVCNPK